MGSSGSTRCAGTACECEANKDNEVVAYSTVMEDSVPLAIVEAKAAQSTMATVPVGSLDRLQGRWFTEGDEQVMGEIDSGVIQWDSVFNHSQTQLRLLPGGAVEMELLGTVHRATYEEGAVAKLRWSDGEVWVRKG